VVYGHNKRKSKDKRIKMFFSVTQLHRKLNEAVFNLNTQNKTATLDNTVLIQTAYH
jgi:hypothetical protein